MAKMHSLYQRNKAQHFLKMDALKQASSRALLQLCLGIWYQYPVQHKELWHLFLHVCFFNILGSSIKTFYEMGLHLNTLGSSLGYHISLQSSEPCGCSLQEPKYQPIQLIQVRQSYQLLKT